MTVQDIEYCGAWEKKVIATPKGLRLSRTKTTHSHGDKRKVDPRLLQLAKAAGISPDRLARRVKELESLL